MRIFKVMGIVGLLLTFSSPVWSENYTIRDKNYQTEGYYRNGSVYDKNYRIKGYVREGRIYDSSWRYKGSIDRNNKGNGGRNSGRHK